jgi:hypothetical protein
MSHGHFIEVKKMSLFLSAAFTRLPRNCSLKRIVPSIDSGLDFNPKNLGIEEQQDEVWNQTVMRSGAAEA